MHNELDWPELLTSLSRLTSSEKAKKVCRELGALSSEALALTSSQNILYAQAAISEQSLPELSVVDFIDLILERLSVSAVLDVKELILVRQFLFAATSLKAVLRLSKNPWVESEVARLAEFRSQISAINHVISMSGEINEDASSTLASLCEERRRLTREIARHLDQIVASRKMESLLQDKYVTNREGRMVIPVKSGSQHDVKGLIHDASQTKQTVFMEPEEVIPMNNRLREVQILIQEEIARILKELSHYLGRFHTEFVNAENSIVDCDVIFAKVKMNVRLNGTAVNFSRDGRLVLNELRHPLLTLQGIEVVPNTVTLNEKRRVLLLSGPNAGGKTILLKAIGIASQMARSGLPVPAMDGSFLPFFENLDPIIGDLQSVDQNLSSFSSHIVRLKEALTFKGPNTLILVDEICGATDPEEGAALARSFIETFCNQGVYAVITSHLGPLKENWPEALGVEHGSLEFDNRTNKPTFQLLLGFPGRSLALSVAQRLGVPPSVLERAKSFLTPESKKRTEELEDIEKFKQQILELKTETQRDREEAHKMKGQYLELVKKFREQRDKWLEKALEKAQKRIEQLIEDARQDRLRHTTLHDLKSELPEIVKARSSSAPSKPQTMDEFRNQFKPGTPAYSSRLGRKVLIQSEPDGKGQVTVLADMMRVQLPWHGLSTVQETEGEAPLQVVRRSGASSAVAPREDVSELDLRGKRIDDALAVLEKWLDDCLKNREEQVRIIHGYGTEQLKKAVRQYLSKSRYVEKWKAGDSSIGGDGVTVVTLA